MKPSDGAVTVLPDMVRKQAHAMSGIGVVMILLGPDEFLTGSAQEAVVL